jgi:hypothetical protein
VSARAPYHRGISGSASLATRRIEPAAVPAEALEAGEMRRVPFAGELLGALRVRSSFAAIPLDVFDRASERLEAEEQAAYLHLLRLSAGEGRNWCRAAKRDLMARLRLSERRLLRVLAALVEKGFARPLHRDNRGTLWRVYLPREAFGEPLGDDVLMGRAGGLSVVRAGDANAPTTTTATTTPTPTTTTTPSTTAATTVVRPRLVQGEAALARALASARGREGAEAMAEAARDVRDLLAEGQPPARIAAAIETIRRRRAAGAGAGAPEGEGT